MTPEHFAAIGRITVEYSRLEWIISAFIWKLVAQDQTIGQTITAPMMFRSRVELLRTLFPALIPYGIPADVGRLNVALTQAESAVRKRNEVIHALTWHPTPEGDVVFSNLKRRPAGEWANTPAAVADLEGIADELKLACAAVSDVMMAHFIPSSWSSPFGEGSLYGPSVLAAIAWYVQRGGKQE